MKFREAEKKQLDNNFDMQVYGKICHQGKPPDNEIVCHSVWNYYIKGNGEYKARECLNGKQLTRRGTHYNNTYNVCVNWMPVALTFFALVSMGNLLIYLHDVVNSFMEGTPPNDRLWARIDDTMSEYLEDKLKKTVPVGSFIQLKRMKQGHPEAGNQFDKVVK